MGIYCSSPKLLVFDCHFCSRENLFHLAISICYDLIQKLSSEKQNCLSKFQCLEWRAVYNSIIEKINVNVE